MYIKKIKVENFRNIEFMEIEPHNEINVIYGQNGQGKTNLLEAIWLLRQSGFLQDVKVSEMQRIVSLFSLMKKIQEFQLNMKLK